MLPVIIAILVTGPLAVPLTILARRLRRHEALMAEANELARVRENRERHARRCEDADFLRPNHHHHHHHPHHHGGNASLAGGCAI